MCDDFRLTQQTFQLAVSYVDRFLSLMSISKSNFQLLGITALFIAIKVEETSSASFYALGAKLVWMTDNTYTVEQLFKMEYLILTKLDFDINSPTPHSFQDRFLKASSGGSKEKHFTEYLCNRSLVHGDTFLCYTPSHITAAAIALARAMHCPGKPVWSPTLSHYTKYTYSDIKQCMSDLHQLYKMEFQQLSKPGADSSVGDFTAVWNKYSRDQFTSILKTKPLRSIPKFY